MTNEVDNSVVSESVKKKNRVFFRHQLTLIHELKFTIHELKMVFFYCFESFLAPNIPN